MKIVIYPNLFASVILYMSLSAVLDAEKILWDRFLPSLPILNVVILK